MFNRASYENSISDGFALLEISEAGRRPARFVPLRRTELRGEVVGPLATLRQTQIFSYPVEAGSDAIEAQYRFPLPGDAAVTGVTVRFGEVEIRAGLAEREHAEADYAAAVREGRQAALATRECPDVFSLRVVGIPPGQDVVETSFVVLARAEGPGWTLRLPLTTAPRYVRADEAGTRAAAAQPLALARDPGHRFALDLMVAGAVTASCPSHAIERSPAPGGVRLRLRDGEVVPDRDLVLVWAPERLDDRPALSTWVFDDPSTDRAYFLALVAPPAAFEPGRGVPREVVVLVDRSGSMEGPKWEAAKWAVERFAADLGERDALALGVFNYRVSWWTRSPRPAEPHAVAEAIAFLENHGPTGGTELGIALEQALSRERAPGDRARHVLVITDAQVSDEGRILRLADAEAGRPDRRRISVLCIDAAPNADLAHELAERGGGVARFLTSDPNQGDIATALDEILADWSEPALHGLRLEVDRPGAEATGRRVVADRGDAGRSSIDLGDLPAGRCLWVVGRLTHQGTEPLAFRLLDARGHVLAGLESRPDVEAPGRHAIKAHFGSRRINELEQLRSARYRPEQVAERLRLLGYDPDAVLAVASGSRDRVYAENARRDWREALSRLLLIESLDFGLASSEAAFVATRTEAGKPVGRSVIVANALPAGWPASLPGAAMFSPGTMAPKMARRPRMDRSPIRAEASAPDDDQGLSLNAMRLHRAWSQGPMRMDKSTPAAPSGWAGALRGRMATEPGTSSVVVFEGVPRFDGGEAVLFDSERPDANGGPPEGATLRRLIVRILVTEPAAGVIDPGLEVLLFVGDPTGPRARVRLAALVGRRDGRPLNVARSPGQRSRLVLVDPSGAWASGAPRIAVVLEWS